MNEYLVKCWIKVTAEDDRQAVRWTEHILNRCFFKGWIEDHKILDVIKAEEVSHQWER